MCKRIPSVVPTEAETELPSGLRLAEKLARIKSQLIEKVAGERVRRALADSDNSDSGAPDDFDL